jgi:hypothetical protein
MTMSELPELDTSFPHRYEARAVGWAEASPEHVYYPDPPGLIVELETPDRSPWTAVFAGHKPSESRPTPAVTGLFTTPDEDLLCVVAGGVVYFVEPGDEHPFGRRSMVTNPIRHVLPFPAHGVIVFADIAYIYGYGFVEKPGCYGVYEIWCERLGDDELKVVRVTEDRIEGSAWNAPSEEVRGFSLDVRTGEYEGGAYDAD